MRTFDQLTKEEQDRVREETIGEVVELLLTGGMILSAAHQNIVKRLISEADKMRTPWFAGEMIYGHHILHDVIDKLVDKEVHEIIYSEPGQRVRQL
jgi:hypothetical protein